MGCGASENSGSTTKPENVSENANDYEDDEFLKENNN